MIDIPPKELEIVKTILKQYVPDYRVVVFGSRAKNTARTRSDLDLCLIGDKPLPISDLAALEDALSSSDLKIKVDVVDWQRIDKTFQNIIEKNTLVIQESQKTH